MKIAIYREVKHRFENVHECAPWMEEPGSRYVRLSEPVEVEFTPRQDTDVLKEAVESLKTEIQRVRAEAQKEVENLEEEIQKLLAITHGESARDY
jgi:hypothetical protein